MSSRRLASRLRCKRPGCAVREGCGGVCYGCAGGRGGEWRDDKGASVMCARTGTVIALGPLEFEHDVDTIKGMSGGPVVDRYGNLVGLCEKGRTTTAQKAGVEIKSDSRYLQVRNFATVLHNINWRKFTQMVLNQKVEFLVATSS